MLRHVTLFRPLRHALPAVKVGPFTRCFAARTNIDLDEADADEARTWLANVNADTFRRSVRHSLSFSRSSGPGGQNVNKVSSKATLRIPTESLIPMIPKLLRPAILSSRLHTRSGDLVIQSDEFRKQSENISACWRTLHDLIVQAGREAVPGKTSAAQKERVRGLIKAEAAGRMKIKVNHSKKKANRKVGGRGGD